MGRHWTTRVRVELYVWLVKHTKYGHVCDYTEDGVYVGYCVLPGMHRGRKED